MGKGLKRDVLPLKPTLVTVKFGMNDHSYQPFREDIFRAYVRSQAEIGKELAAKGARIVPPSGRPLTQANIGSALAGRELARHLREIGVGGGGPAPLTRQDRSRFLSALDTALQAALRVPMPT